MRNEQNTTLPDKPKGFSVWLGRIVGAVLILSALGIAFVNYLSGAESSQTIDQSAPYQSQPSTDDDALRKSLGGK